MIRTTQHTAANPPEQLRTQRLTLRHWRRSDLRPFARLCADPKVMEFFPKTNTLFECQEMMRLIQSCFDTRGFGLWAVQTDAEKFIGFVGLYAPTFSSHFTPCVEIGWRLHRQHWGQGLAVEAANAALDDGFTRCGLEEIVSFTAKLNTRSIRVMEKLGMTHDPADDFDHPKLEDSSPLKPHVLYRLSRQDWLGLRENQRS